MSSVNVTFNKQRSKASVKRRRKKDYKKLMISTNQMQELCWFTSGIIVDNRSNSINHEILFPTFVDCWDSQRTIDGRDSLLHNISSTITLSVGSKTGRINLIQPESNFSHIERIPFDTIKQVRHTAKNIMLKACDYMRAVTYKTAYVSDWKDYLVGFPTVVDDYSNRIVNIINSLGGRVSEDTLYSGGKIIEHYRQLYDYYANSNPLTACMIAAIIMNNLRGEIVGNYLIRSTSYESTYDETLRVTTIMLFLQAILKNSRLKNVLKIDSINSTKQIVKVFTLLQTLFYTLFNTINRRLKLFIKKNTISKRVIEDNKSILVNKDFIYDNSVKLNLQYCAFYNITTRNLRLRVDAVDQILRVDKNMSKSNNIVSNNAIDSIIGENIGLESFSPTLLVLTTLLNNSQYKSSKNRISIIGDNMSLKDSNIARLVLESMMDEPFDRWRDTNTIINSMNNLDPNIVEYLSGSNGRIGRAFVIELSRHIKNSNGIRRKKVIENFNNLITLANIIVKLSFKASKNGKTDFIYKLFQERFVNVVYDANHAVMDMKREYAKLVKTTEYWFRYGNNISAVGTIFGKTLRFSDVEFNEYEVIADALRDIEKTVARKAERTSKRLKK